MTKLNKQKIINLKAGVIDAKYMAAKVESEAEKKQWLDHANDLLQIINKLQNK